MAPSELARFVALLSEPAFVLSLDGRIEASNAAADALFGTGREGRGRLHDLTPEPANVERLLRVWARSGRPLPGALKIHGADGPVDYRVEGARVRTPALPDRLFLRFRTRESATQAFRTLNDKIAELGHAIGRRKRAESRIAGQLRLLEKIARATSLVSSLEAIAEFIEAESEHRVVASILLLEGSRLRHGAAPSLPDAYVRAIDGIEIGPAAGSCGTAAHRREPVVVPDIAEDDLWKDFRDLALEHGLRACWSIPVLSQEGEVLATVAHYCPEAHTPDAGDLELAQIARDFAGIAIERSRVVTALEARADELAEINARSTEFLAMLGHELRNPLSPIVTTLELLRSGDPAPVERERWLDILDRQVNLMRRLVDDLVDIARVTRGRIELRRTTVDLRDVVDLAWSEDAGDARVGVAKPARPVWVDADPERLQQAVSNLLENARKFTPADGKIELVCGAAEGQATLRIRDTGEGIAPERIAAIFELFAQGSQALHRPRGGLGIGLALVKTIVEMHGGTIEARSEGPGRGSEFEIRLPLREAAARIDGGATSAPLPEASPVLDVLIVDDEADSAGLLSTLLARWGHRTRVVHDGRAAIEAAVATPPDLVLLDIGLPELDGFEVARRLCADAGIRRKGSALVALTGYGQESDRARAREAGFDEFLVKPVGLAVLEPLIARLAAR